MKWIVVWLDEESPDLTWDEFDTEADAKAATDADADDQNRKWVLIHGTLKGFDT